MNTQIIKEPKIVFEHGKPSEVILAWKDFESLLEKAEDIYDLSEIRKIKKNLAFKRFDDFLNEQKF